MKIRDFKKHTITRSSPAHQENYQNYRSFLRQDFCGRCAYCNLLDTTITTPFEIDHFVPRAAFKEGRMELETDYENLVYSCKKCNNAKRGQFQGDIHALKPTNDLFYDPVKTDYNTIFYRNECGMIASDDEKGKESINRLKLYRPIHILAWVCEELNETAGKLEKAIETECDEERRETLEAALNKINGQYRKLNHLFIAAYNDNNLSIADVNTGIENAI